MECLKLSFGSLSINLSFDAFNAWTDSVRAQLALQPQVAPAHVPTYQPFITPRVHFGDVFNNPTAVSWPASGNMSQSVMDDDATSADDNDISSAEDSDDDLSTVEDDDDDDTSSADDDDLSSAEDYDDDTSSIEGAHNGLSASAARDDEPTYGNITTLRPNNERPNISLELVKDSTLASKLPGFLAQMRAANQELEEEKSAGTLANRRIELDESDNAAEDGHHIEMNLGLGVLEEKSYDTSTTTESDSSSEEGDIDIMEKLLGGKRKRGLGDVDEGAPKKSKIQEV